MKWNVRGIIFGGSNCVERTWWI